MKKPLILGIVASLALATGGVLLWLSIPDPAGPVEERQEPRIAQPGTAATTHGTAGAEFSGASAEEQLADRNRPEPGAAGNPGSRRAVVRDSSKVTSIFQMTVPRMDDIENPAGHDIPAQKRLAEHSRAMEQVQALGPVFFKDERDGVEESPIRMPLSQLDPDPAIDWTEQAVAGLNALRDRFAKHVAADRLDPANPEYSKRWRDAQPANDDAYRQMFGQAAFNAKQLEAGRQQALEAQQEGNATAN